MNFLSSSRASLMTILSRGYGHYDGSAQGDSNKKPPAGGQIQVDLSKLIRLLLVSIAKKSFKLNFV